MINAVNTLSTVAATPLTEHAPTNGSPFEAMMHAFGLGAQADPVGQSGQERAIIIVGGAPKDRSIIIVGGKPEAAAHGSGAKHDALQHIHLHGALSEHARQR